MAEIQAVLEFSVSDGAKKGVSSSKLSQSYTIDTGFVGSEHLLSKRPIRKSQRVIKKIQETA